MLYEVPHFINGKRVSSSGRKMDIYNPAIGTVAGYINVADKVLIEQVVGAAKAAFLNWSTTTPLHRAKILFRFKALLDENIQALASLVTQEHGKTLLESAGSIQRGIDVVDFSCCVSGQLMGNFFREASREVDCYSMHQPIGVCVGVTPFNFPAMIPLWMFPIAIACGNTFILKPSEKDPSCSIKLVELAKEAGMPDGVLNVIQGDSETVDGLMTHSDVKAVSFVGSSKVAEHVFQTAIAHNKRAQAFGGAKNHCVIMPDADLDQAVDMIIPSAYGSAGERCMAISVVVVVGDQTADAFIHKMLPKIKNIRVGDGCGTDVDMGPLVTQPHWDRVNAFIESGVKEGATLLVNGSGYKQKERANGYFMGASLFDRVTPAMQIYREEIFGPVLSIVRVTDFSEALKLVNEHQYGNGAAIFTRDGYTARQFSEKVQVGMVGINVPVPVPVAYQSFGGWKHSIFSDIGMYGSEAIRFYTKLKTVTQRWSSKGAM